MIKKRLPGDLKVSYRPYRMDEVIGNERIKRTIANSMENESLPHASLFTGPRGCGKTTFAQIIALGLNCEEGITPNPCCVCDTCKSIINRSSLAVQVVDGTHTGNVDYIRKLCGDFSYGSLSGERNRVVIIDEAHGMSKKASEALLDSTEYTPAHLYIILCTDEPQSVDDALRDRCVAGTINFGRLESKYIFELLEQVSQFEGIDYDKKVLEYIADNSFGTPRTALGILQQVDNEGSWDMETVRSICEFGADVDVVKVFDFCKILVSSRKWEAIVESYNKIKNIPPEESRLAILSYLSGCLRKSRSADDAYKFSRAMDVISQPYYSNGSNHILLNSCFKVNEILSGRY